MVGEKWCGAFCAGKMGVAQPPRQPPFFLRQVNVYDHHQGSSTELEAGLREQISTEDCSIRIDAAEGGAPHLCIPIERESWVSVCKPSEVQS